MVDKVLFKKYNVLTKNKKEVNTVGEKNMRDIYEALQGITYLEWKKLSHAINRHFENEASKQENNILIGSPEELEKSYKYHSQ